MKNSKRIQVLLLFFFLAGFIVDVFYFPVILNWESDFRLLLLVLDWLLIVKLSHSNSRATFKITLIFLLLLSLFFIFFPNYPPTERIASWIYIFLAVGIIQELFESPKKSKKTKSN